MWEDDGPIPTRKSSKTLSAMIRHYRFRSLQGLGMTTVLGVLIAALAVGLVVWQRSSRRDETFAGITPGLLPAPGQLEQRIRIGRGQAAPVAVRFDPPPGVRPALAGLIAESRLEPVAISATLVDLAVRGWLRMHPIEAEATRSSVPATGC